MDSINPTSWRAGEHELALPAYFPSVSSVKTNLAPCDYVAVLNRVFSGRQYLISAFDVMRTTQEDQKSLIAEVKSAQENGTVILMDSGNYESYWKSPLKKWLSNEFYEALRLIKPTMAFGFDDQRPSKDLDLRLRELLKQFDEDKRAFDGLLIPIVHGTPEELISLCPEFASTSNTEAIAVPERELGAGLFERVDSIRKIRNALNKVKPNIILHLLGTGNPLSIAIYAAEGANSFDGLEWCQTSVDHETALLHHFSHADMFNSQTPWGSSDFDFVIRTLAHNLEFYRDWMSRLIDSTHRGNSIEFCRRNFPERIFVQISENLGWGGSN